MERPIALALLILATTAVAFGEPANIVFPAGSGVVDVTSATYGADKTGATDATAAIQKALTEKKGYQIIYFPAGTYKISNTLLCATYATDGAHNGPIIVGQSRTGTVIRLTNGTFTDANNPKPMLITGDGVAQCFNKVVYNMTFSIGRNNPGANGVYFYSNNAGLISEVNIISEDGQGNKGLDLGYGEQGPCGAKSVYVKGFKYGVYCDALNGVACTQISVEGQTIAGVYNNNRYLWIDSLTSINTVPAAINKGDMALINVLCTGGSSANSAIQNTGTLFARGITAQGYSRALTSSGAPTGMSVTEYTSGGYKSLWTESPAQSMNLPIQRPPHVNWDSDSAKWACALAYKGRLGQPQRTDLQAMQAAVDAPGKTVVFLTANKSWVLDDTLFLRGGIQRLVGGGTMFNNGTGRGAIVITDQCTAPEIAINWFNGAPIINRSSKKVVIQSMMGQVYGQGTGELYIVDICGGARIMNPSQRLWAWQFNAEGGSMTESASATQFSLRMDANAGRAWIFGWKDEGNGIASVCYGGRTEIIGFFQYTAADASHPAEHVINGGAFSLALKSELCWNCGGGLGYSTLISETRSGVTRTFRDSDNGGWDGYGVFTAYRPSDVNGLSAQPPVSVPHRRATLHPASIASARGVVQVTLDGNANSAASIRLLNARGQLVRSNRAAQAESVTFDGLQPGSYLVQVRSGGGSVTQKTVVAR